MKVSIIIPTYNEALNIPNLLPYLRQAADKRLLEIIVVDGGSNDDTVSLAREYGADLILVSPKGGRACQMNYGAKYAKGNMLYFVHADTFPPKSYLNDIESAHLEGFPMGCYRYQFDSDHPLLRFNAYCTRFDRIVFRGGDQTLYIEQGLFDRLEGFDESYKIMEDYDILIRARKEVPFRIIQKDAIVSARKYENNSYLRVNLSNFIVFTLFLWGYPTEKLAKLYKWLLN